MVETDTEKEWTFDCLQVESDIVIVRGTKIEEKGNIFYGKSMHANKIYDGSRVTVKILASSTEKELADLLILSLEDAKLMVKHEVGKSISELPVAASKIVNNKAFMKSFIRYQLENVWTLWPHFMTESYMIPEEFKAFIEKYKDDAGTIHFFCRGMDQTKAVAPFFITANIPRIAEHCKKEPLMVTKYIADQPLFKNRRFSLIYPIIYLVERKVLYVNTQPVVRRCTQDATDKVDTLKLSANLPEEYFAPDYSNMFEEFQKEMEKQLEILYTKRGHYNPPSWKEFEDTKILKVVGQLGMALASKLKIEMKYKEESAVVYGINILLDNEFVPHMCDVETLCPLPTENSLVAIAKLGYGKVEEENFAQMKLDNARYDKKQNKLFLAQM